MLFSKASEVLRAIVGDLPTLRHSGPQPLSGQGHAFGVDFRSVSLLILTGQGRIPALLDDVFLNLMRCYNVSLIRHEEGREQLAQLLARVTRSFAKDSDPSCPHVPSDKHEVNLSVDPPLGLQNLWAAQWQVLTKSVIHPNSKKLLLEKDSIREKRAKVLRAIIDERTDEDDLKEYPLINKMLFPSSV